MGTVLGPMNSLVLIFPIPCKNKKEKKKEKDVIKSIIMCLKTEKFGLCFIYYKYRWNLLTELIIKINFYLRVNY